MALALADHHRLRRLSGLLDGLRHRRRRDQGPRAVGRRPHGARALDRGGRRALPLLHRRLRALHGPGDVDGGPGRARLGPRARLRRVHAVQRRPRLHGALDRAHAPLARSLPGLARRARARRASSSTGSSRAASTRTCASRRRRRSPRGPSTGSRSAARSAPTSRRCTRSSAGRSPALDDARPRHLLGIGDVDDLIRGVELGVDTFDCAMPTRLGRHGVAIVPEPEQRWRVDLTAARWKHSRRADHGGLPVPVVRGRLHARLPALPAAQRELTAMRLLTVHNLAYLARLMADLRAAIAAASPSGRGAARRRGAVGARRRVADARRGAGDDEARGDDAAAAARRHPRPPAGRARAAAYDARRHARPRSRAALLEHVGAGDRGSPSAADGHAGGGRGVARRAGHRRGSPPAWSPRRGGGTRVTFLEATLSAAVRRRTCRVVGAFRSPTTPDTPSRSRSSGEWRAGSRSQPGGRGRGRVPRAARKGAHTASAGVPTAGLRALRAHDRARRDARRRRRPSRPCARRCTSRSLDSCGTASARRRCARPRGSSTRPGHRARLAPSPSRIAARTARACRRRRSARVVVDELVHLSTTFVTVSPSTGVICSCELAAVSCRRRTRRPRRAGREDEREPCRRRRACGGAPRRARGARRVPGAGGLVERLQAAAAPVGGRAACGGHPRRVARWPAACAWPSRRRPCRRDAGGRRAARLHLAGVA